MSGDIPVNSYVLMLAEGAAHQDLQENRGKTEATPEDLIEFEGEFKEEYGRAPTPEETELFREAYRGAHYFFNHGEDKAY